MFNFFKKKTLEQSAFEHLTKYSQEIKDNKLGPLGAIIEFTTELKDNKLHQELGVIIDSELQHPKPFYLCASLMLLLYHKNGVYESFQNEVNIEELAKDSYIACSRIITNDDFLMFMSASATSFLDGRADEEQKYISAWESWLNNLELLKKVFT
jgi:hypothetical protein